MASSFCFSFAELSRACTVHAASLHIASLHKLSESCNSGTLAFVRTANVSARLQWHFRVNSQHTGKSLLFSVPEVFFNRFFGRGAFDTPPTPAFKSWYARQTAACWDRGLASIVAVSDDEDTSQSVSTRQSTPWNPHVVQASCFAAQGFRLL